MDQAAAIRPAGITLLRAAGITMRDLYGGLVVRRDMRCWSDARLLPRATTAH